MDHCWEEKTKSFTGTGSSDTDSVFSRETDWPRLSLNWGWSAVVLFSERFLEGGWYVKVSERHDWFDSALRIFDGDLVFLSPCLNFLDRAVRCGLGFFVEVCFDARFFAFIEKQREKVIK